MAAWKTALVGKTFVPDIKWFADWVNFPPGFTGGWTSASTFGDDYTSNGWVWDKDVRNVAESASICFNLEGPDLVIEVKQTLDGKAISHKGKVTIDPDKNILNISVPLVSYAGTAGSWLPSTNEKSVTGSKNDWYFVAHGGSNLSNIDTQGFWLGAVANSTAAGDTKDEILIFHFLKK
jgi:hypothetical protein